MRWTLSLLFFFLGLGHAQTWYYNVDQLNRIDPDLLEYRPTADDLVCAGLLTPGAVPPGGVSVSGVPQPPGCPAAPPVVVYARDPVTGDPVYAVLLTVKFWGRKRWWDANYGVSPLIWLLQSEYLFRVDVSGDYAQVNAQYAPPWISPPVSQALSGGAWLAWLNTQAVALGQPQVSNRRNYSFLECLFQGIVFEDEDGNPVLDRCWSAELTWAMPVRLVVEGTEQGAYSLTLSPGLFEERPSAAAVQSLRGSEFVPARGRVVPFRR